MDKQRLGVLIETQMDVVERWQKTSLHYAEPGKTVHPDIEGPIRLSLMGAIDKLATLVHLEQGDPV